MISVRVITVDHYIAKQIPELRPDSSSDSKQWQEPIIRIFGPTANGVKTCVHVHGVYPYIYVPYKGGDNPDRDALLLAAALDQALLMQFNQKSARYIHKVTLVSGIPLYGYHSKSRLFFKIFFLNPHHIRKSADLLLSGAILGQKFQPHEAHVPYTLQFMMDYNIYGMSFIDLAKVKYRRDPENREYLADIKEEDLLPHRVKKITRSRWEVDALAEDVLNKDRKGTAGGNPGLLAIWEDEKARRRAKGRTSQITPQSTQSRPNVELTSNELLYKERLANKLKNVVAEKELPDPATHTKQLYPAEVPETSQILEASFLGVQDSAPSRTEDIPTDLDDLIDGKILSQMVASQENETDSENEEAKIEDDSVLGWFRRDDEEAELEEEDGGDMTQPLDQDENVLPDFDANPDERGKNNSDDEDEFWKNMADKIMQLDGADDSSSGSEEDAVRRISVEGAADRMLSNRSPGNESVSNWSGNIMSLLSEPTGFPTAQTAYQTPQTFWSDWSPGIQQTDSAWFPRNRSDGWSWEKNDAPLVDCLPSEKNGRNQTESNYAFSAVSFDEDYATPFSSTHGEYFHGNYTPTSTMSPTSNVGSVYAIPPPSAVLTPASETDNYSDVNLDSVCDTVSQVSDSPSRRENPKKKNSSQTNDTFQNKERVKENRNKLIESLKNFRRSENGSKKVSLTLKQYIKSCGNVVNVDLKKLNNKEMVVIEYKPINGNGNKNKFLIKPLDKFLEDWEKEEKNINGNGSEKVQPKLINGFTETRKDDPNQLNTILNTLENKYTGDWFDQSKIETIKNKFVVKSVEMLPDNSEEKISRKNKSYKVNENVISDGKIKMKLKKSPDPARRIIGEVGEAVKKVPSKVRKSGKEATVDLNYEKQKDEIGSDSEIRNGSLVSENRVSYSKRISRDDNKITKNAKENKNNLLLRSKANSITKKHSVKESSIDPNLIAQINEDFEEYFRNVVRKTSDEESSSTSCEDSEDDTATGRRSKSDSHRDAGSNESSNFEPVKFVSQLLTAFSCLSNSNNKIPPLSITINLGNPTKVPIQLNFQSNVNKKKACKTKIDNVDGPADDSSSEDSSDSAPVVRTPSKKRQRKNSNYRPLDLVVQKSPGKNKSDVFNFRKRKAVSNLSEAGSSSYSDSAVVCPVGYSDGSKFPRDDMQAKMQSNLGSNPEKEIPVKDLIKLCHDPGKFDSNDENRVMGSPSEPEFISSNEPDIIEDSGSEKDTPLAKRIRKLKIDKKIKNVGLRSRSSTIPQTDAVVSSSDDEDVRLRVSQDVKRIVSESEETSKSSTPPCSFRKVVEEVDLTGDDENPEYLGKGIVSFYYKTDLNISGLDMSNVFDESGSVTLIEKRANSPESDDVTQTPRRQESGSSNGSLAYLTQKLPDQTTPDRIAVNSDDSIQLSRDPSEKSNDVSPFPLSGTQLLSEDKNEDGTLCDDFGSPFRLSGVESLADSAKSQEIDAAPDVPSPPKIQETTISDSPPPETPEDFCFPSRSMLIDEDGSDDPFCSSKNSSAFSSEPAFTKPGNFVPKRKSPTTHEVKSSLAEYGIRDVTSRLPFYSDAKDISKPMEVGCRLLKIENYSIAGLKTHKCSLDVSGTEERRNSILNFQKKGSRSVRSVLITDREIILRPLKRPPRPCEVVKWYKTKNLDKDEKKEDVTPAKKKLTMPASPDQDSGSDDDVTLSLTPASPGERKDESKPPSPVPANKTGEFKSRRRVSFEDGSSGDSPIPAKHFPRHSTPNRKFVSPNLDDSEIKLKKGPLNKIKGIMKRSLLNKLQAIAEDQVQVQENFQKLSEESDKKSGASSKDMFGEEKSLSKSSEDSRHAPDDSYQIQGVTWDNTYGFRDSVEFLQHAKALHDNQHVTMLVMELHVQTRGELRPDPQHDPIRALFYTLTCDGPTFKQETGVVVVVGGNALKGTGVSVNSIVYVPDEASLFQKVIESVRDWDPDILAGYEIEMHSWGYLIQRGYIFEVNLLSEIGRTLEDNFNRKEVGGSDSQNLEFDDAPGNIRHMRIAGRIVLDVWRLLRHEVALTSYTFENVMYHLTHQRIPQNSYKSLSHFWEHKTDRLRYITVEYYLTRVEGIVRLLDQLDFINRTSELARLFGIQFYEVLSRGSQFRVESMMLRLAKPLNFVPCSPSVRQRATMRAPASLPLIMEPESMFYADPVIVLDFQSLYPSMIIAYNYCFSTCLGRIEMLGGREPFEFGCTHLQISPEELKRLENDINISPAGVAFVKQNIRKGVLPRMLEEILETRLMVKKSMKENKSNKLLQKVLHARQLGLKLIANVTYGYTAANFSGRMPAIEVGDSVVSKGRETLQRAIQVVKTTTKWGARVIYGDTDSLFVLIPGKSRNEAFRIGAEIADAVTESNPKPVKLKLEKVYQPCILQTKKRYVGYMYESPDQEKPVYDAKGIETVRRDGCPATAKILQKALQILFETRDVSLVKKYTVRQFTKLFQGRVNIQDLIFAKEYRGRSGYRPGACVPALTLAKQWTQTDKRAEPRKKERVPYVIVNGPPGVPLIRLVRSPRDLLEDSSLRINATYYITKAIIPPMQRCFSLLGADVASWYSEMPRKYHKTVRSTGNEKHKKSTISQYFATVECVVCSEVTNSPICQKCQGDHRKLALVLNEKIRRCERSYDKIIKVCESCCGRNTATDCISLDCPVLYRRCRSYKDLDQVPILRQILHDYLQF